VYEFMSAAGAPARLEEQPSAHAPIGQTAVVFYPADAPDRARLAGANSGIGWGLLVFGLICFGIGKLHLRTSRSEPRVPSIKNRQKAQRRKNRTRATRRSAR
jgi:hypothetical protein